MQTRADQGEPATLFSVLRVQQDILTQSSVGFLVADREPFDGHSNRAMGTDFTLATSRWRGHRNLTVSGYLFGTQTPGTPDGWAGSLLVDYPNDFWRINVRHTEIQQNLNLRLNFLPSSGSTLFLVYNRLWQRNVSVWRTADQAVLLKAVYQLKI